MAGNLEPGAAVTAGAPRDTGRDSRSLTDVTQVVIRAPGEAEAKALIRRWQDLVPEVPVLRSRLTASGVASESAAAPDVQQLDWSSLSDDAACEARFNRFREADRERGFPAIGEPLLRLACIAWSGGQRLLLLTLHADLLDRHGLRELLIAWLAGELPHPDRSPDESAEADAHFWHDYLADYQAPDRLTLPRGADAGPEQGTVEQRLTAPQSRDIRAFRKNAGATLNTLTRSAWALLLAHYLDQPDIVFGVSNPVDLRRHAAQLLPRPLRIAIAEELSVGQLLRKVRDAARRARDHAWCTEYAGDAELFDSGFAFHWRDPEAGLAAAAQSAGVELPEIHAEQRPGLILEVCDEPEILLRLRYRGDRFDSDGAAQILRHYAALLLNMTYQPAARALAVPYLTEMESRPLLWPGMTVVPRESASGSLVSRFAAQALNTPDNIAVSAGEEQLSYRELDLASTALAWRLRAAGVVPGSRVGLCVERDLALAIGMLGILKSGAAYVPLDPGYPAERMNLIMEDAELDIVVAPPALQKAISQDRVRCVNPVGEGEPAPAPPPGPLPEPAPDDLAYLIYTSGSTGRPKGVMVTHHNAVRLFDASRGWLRPGPADVWTLFHSFAFDFSVWEIWGALLYGGRLEIVPETIARDPEAFYRLLSERGVTVLSQTPSAFLQLVKVDAEQGLPLDALRFVIFGGEALDLASLRGWVERHGDRAPVLVNMYGITETTVHVTYRPLTRDDVMRAEASLIGYPLPDLYIRLLDRAGRPVPPGVPGEICVGGAGVARGYLKRPELNQQRFAPDHLSGNADARLYRSGDYARRVPSGELAYLGRQDDQVKIRGFRIDLGEITSTLRQLPGIRDGVAIAHAGSQGVKRLVAYYVAENPAVLTEAQVREQLVARLPGHMVPAFLIGVSRIPLTRNNKADVKSLPEPVEHSARMLTEAERPRGELEIRLAAIWAGVLERSDIARQDDFFALGGDSLLALQVVAAARADGLSLAPRQLFAKASLADLAATLEPITPVLSGPEAPAAAGASAGPLTPMQSWFFAQHFERPNHWNQAFLFRAPVMLDLEALEAAAQRVVARHDALYHVFQADAGGGYRSVVLPVERAVEFSLVELEHLNAEERQEAVELVAREVQDSLDIHHGPLVRIAHFSGTDPEGGRLLIALHHLVADSFSWRIFMADMETAYRALLQGCEPVFAPATATFDAWARALDAHVSALDPAAVAARWDALVAGAEFAHWPAARSGPTPERDAVQQRFTLPADASRILIEQAQQARGANTEDCLLAALALAAARQWPDADRLGIDLKRHGRPELDAGLALGRTIGWFSSLHPFVLNLMPQAGIGAVLRDVAARLHAVPDLGMDWSLLHAHDDTAGHLLFSYRNGNGLSPGEGLFPMVEEAAGPWHAPENHLTHALEIGARIDRDCLDFTLRGDPNRISRAQFDALADAYRTALLRVADFCRAQREPMHTPADFQRVRITQEELDRLPFAAERIETILPLAPIQRLYHAAASVDPRAGFEQWVFRLEGDLDRDAFESAWQQLLRRHAVLRSVFVDAGQSEVRQVVLRPFEWHLDSLDWRDLTDRQQQERSDAWLAADRERAFELARGPLTRVTLMQLGAAQWQLVWSYHLIQIDGWSWPLLLRELGELYDAARESREPILGEAGDYTAYLDWLSRRDLEEYSRFWKDQLEGMRPDDGKLPAFSPADKPQRIRLELADSLSRALEAAAREWRVTPSVLFQAAWGLLLSAWCGTDTPVFGAVFSGRTAGIEQADQMVGPLVNNLPVRIRIDADQSLHGWLARLREQYAELNHFQNAAPAELLNWAGLPPGRRLFESLLVYQNVSTRSAAEPWGSSLKVRPVRAGITSHFPLTIVVTPGPRFRLEILGQANGPAPELLEVLAGQLTATLSRMVRGREMTLRELREASAWSLAEFTGPPAAPPAPRAPIAAWALPRDPLEVRIADICREVLGLEQLGCDQNFFDLGAQSLSLIEIHARLQSELETVFPIVTLFQYPTVGALARHLAGDTTTVDDATARRAAAQRAAMRKRRGRELHPHRPG